MRTILVLMGLAAASAGYNALIDRYLRRSRLLGATALQVAAGTGYTLAVAAWLVDGNRYWRTLGLLLAAFAAAGAPMVLGDVARDYERY